MQNLASRYKAFLALLPLTALVLIVAGIIPLADGVPVTPVIYTLGAMCVALLTGDLADSALFVRAVVHYLAQQDFADDTIEAELDSLDALLSGHPVGVASVDNPKSAG